MARRRIKKARIEFISLVPAGANKLPVIYKDDGHVDFVGMNRMDDKGELLNVVYAAEQRDSQGDIASAEVVKDMAYEFIANGAKVDIRHDGKALTKEQARIAETFIVQKDDSRFQGWKNRDGEQVDLTGAWATVIKIDDPALREKYRSGEWGGVSMGGTAVVEHEKEDQLDRFAEILLGKLGHNPVKRSKTMDEKTMAEIVAKSVGEAMKPLAGLGEAVAKIAEALTKKPEEKPVAKTEEPKAPTYAGKPDDEAALLKFERELELFEVRKAADLTTAAGIKAYREAVAELKKGWEPAKKSTNQDPADGEGDEDTSGPRVLSMSKEDRALLKAGREAISGKKE